MKYKELLISVMKKAYRLFFQIKVSNYLCLKRNKVTFKRLLMSGRTRIYNRGTIKLGNNVVINSGVKKNVLGVSTAFEVYSGARLRIGDGVNMSNIRIRCEREIVIDNDVMLGGGVTVMDSNCHSCDFAMRMFGGNADIVSLPVHIKRGAFIGTNVLVLKGVTIGEEAIIAAGSVVTKSVPDYEVWGGNPAQRIRPRTDG